MNVAFRADASAEMGAGHVMRCLCLADALRDRGATIRFVSRRLPEALRDVLAAHGHDVAVIGDGAEPPPAGALTHARWLGTTQAADADATATALRERRWDWLVVDHYALDARWETSLRRRATQILAIDDIADRRHDCDALLDQNLHADMGGRYREHVSTACQLLLGPRYALVRDEFTRTRRDIRARTGAVARVLVSFGGSDTKNLTGAAIDALVDVGVQAVDVVIGAAFPYRAEVEAACDRHDFVCHVHSDRMAELMAAADVAVGGGGITTWERCCVGLPAIAVALAANQRDVIDEAARQGLVYAVEAPATPTALALHIRALLDNPRLREMLSRRGMEAVDGLGVDRVVRVLDAASIQVRPATTADADALFAWRSHDSVRSASRQSGAIERSEHDAWLGRVLADADRSLLIGERRGTPVGVVRFDVQAQQAEVSIYRVPSSTERGAGPGLLLAAEAWLRQRRPDVGTVTAEVLAGNERSHRLFRSAGYELHATTYVKQVRPS